MKTFITIQRKIFRVFIKGLILVIAIHIWLPPAISLSDLKESEVPDNVLVFSTNIHTSGTHLEVFFEMGKSFKDPLMAIWIEDLDGNYIESLYVAKSIATGVFRQGIPSEGRWLPGPLRRPAALPYWGHKRGVRAEDGLFVPSQTHPMSDAYTGATPKSSFRLQTQSPSDKLKQFVVFFEINQSWDWNDYWTSDKFPDELEYRTSGQPALVYAVKIDLESKTNVYEMSLVGHSHRSGATGELFPDTSTLTTALDITNSILVKINNVE